MYKQKLEEFFKKYQKEISIQSLISMFKIKENEIDILLDSLYELEKEGKIYRDKNGNYIHISKDYYLSIGVINKSSKNNYYINLKKGKIVTIPESNLNGAKENDVVYFDTKKGTKHNKQIIGNVLRVVKKPICEETKIFYKVKLLKNYLKNYYFALVNNKIVYISTKDLNGAFIGDYVTIQLVDNKYAKVVNIIERKNNNHVFEYKNIDGNLCWIPINSNYSTKLNLNSKLKFLEGDKILAEITEENNLKFIKKLDNKNNLRVTVENLLYDNGFKVEFSKDILNEADNLDKSISECEIKSRVDLRNLETFTIDGARAKDLDDAVSLKKVEDGYILYVHIADVSTYIKPNSKLFKEAYERGTSIYPANYVVPMFPSIISNDICSLNPNCDKLTKTIEMHIDNDGNVTNFNIYKSIINSNIKMSYNKVNNILENKEVYSDYIDYVETLKNMNELSKILIEKRKERGQLSLDLDKMDFNYDDNDNVVGMMKCSRGPAELLIESFMLETNETIASFAYNLCVPFAYRNHEGPNIDQLNKLKYELNEFRQIIKNVSNIKNSGNLQKVLTSILDKLEKEEKEVLSNKILSCLNRAYYSSYNVGHYALALPNYATFTSPIRRMPDLINHIIIDYILDGKIDKIDEIFNNLENMMIWCSEKQKNADRFEKNVNGLVLNKLLTDLIDEELVGTILFISQSSIFIKTNNDFFGIIPIKNKMYKNNMVCINNKEYRAGDNINIMIDYVDERNNEIIFKVNKEKNKVLKKERKEDKND